LCEQLSGDLSPLAELTLLQILNLSGCFKLSGDLSPLAELTSLQSLKLVECWQLSGDLRPLAELTSLQSLTLYGCTGIRQFAPLEPLLARLKELFLCDCRFDDLPSEVCGQEFGQNVIREVRAHFDDLKAGRELDAELKVFILGNGGVGKTQLARRLRDLNYDPEIPTTHGIELNFIRTNVDLEHFKGASTCGTLAARISIMAPTPSFSMARQFSFSFGNRKRPAATGKRTHNINPLRIGWIICAR
jgi:internalin A